MKLEFRKVSEEVRELLPGPVYAHIMNSPQRDLYEAAEIDPAFADGESLHREYGVAYEEEVNCLVVEASRGETVRYAALVVPYGRRASMNAKVRGPLDAKKVVFADLGKVCEMTGMEYGSITPVGLPEDWTILIDPSVLLQEKVIVGGGLAKSKLRLPSVLFEKMLNCIIVEGLAKE